ncbi:DUF397 domain-containing protein [Actinomadura sp. LD22]|uniref:DUF397 domain-containing protein n=1 Tax=Actinomadura physcomitrii TaxID=2650748 RepID=A0A6I4MKL0_9ACTN|nr:DUF397 domain-containing protein [Actinomadura physcomitrii]MWA04724.1 DUF397 domain-containing protein [Actinomadura physcomitrii]
MGGECVEIAATPGEVSARNSKVAAGPVLTSPSWALLARRSASDARH